ncbi:hypothetical protein ABK040_013228 [Willaertia magna]
MNFLNNRRSLSSNFAATNTSDFSHQQQQPSYSGAGSGVVVVGNDGWQGSDIGSKNYSNGKKGYRRELEERLQQHSGQLGIKKNKVAIVISGSIRSFPELIPQYLRDFFVKNQYPDVFLSLVYQKEEERKRYLKVKDFIPNIRGEEIEMFSKDVLEERIESEIGWFPCLKTESERLEKLRGVKGCYNWFSSLLLMKRANELRKQYVKNELNGKEYDFIIRLRTDLLFDRIISISNNTFNSDTLYLPFDFHWENGYNDLFAFGEPQIMNIYFSQLEYFNGITRRFKMYHYHPETYLKNCMEDRGVKKVIKHSQIDCKVVRDIHYYEPS